MKPISLVTQDLTLGDDGLSVTKCRIYWFIRKQVDDSHKK